MLSQEYITNDNEHQSQISLGGDSRNFRLLFRGIFTEEKIDERHYRVKKVNYVATEGSPLLYKRHVSNSAHGFKIIKQSEVIPSPKSHTLNASDQRYSVRKNYAKNLPITRDALLTFSVSQKTVYEENIRVLSGKELASLRRLKKSSRLESLFSVVAIFALIAALWFGTGMLQSWTTHYRQSNVHSIAYKPTMGEHSLRRK